MVLARTVADGCARERNVERTHPQLPDPQSETGTLATHSGKKKFAENSNDSNVLSSCEMIRCEVPHQWLGQQEIAASVTRFHEIGKFLLSAVGKSTATLDCLFKS